MEAASNRHTWICGIRQYSNPNVCQEPIVPPKRTSSPARLERSSAMRVAVEKALTECQECDANQKSVFPPASLHQSRADLKKKGIGKSFIDHIEIKKIKGKKTKVVWVHDDPINFYKIDLLDKPNCVIQTSYGPISKQLQEDINARPPNICGFDLQNIEPDLRIEFLVGNMLKRMPPIENAEMYAIYALAGMSQSFEGHTVVRLKTSVVKALRPFLTVNDSPQIGHVDNQPREFTLDVSSKCITVTGTYRLAVKITNTDLRQDPYIAYIIRVKRSYVIEFKSPPQAYRLPDTYELES